MPMATSSMRRTAEMVRNVLHVTGTHTLVLQTTGYSSSSPKLLRIHLKNLNAYRYFCKCKMLLSSHVTHSSSRMTRRVSMWFYPVPSSKSLAHATSANWWLGTLFKVIVYTVMLSFFLVSSWLDRGCLIDSSVLILLLGILLAIQKIANLTDICWSV